MTMEPENITATVEDCRHHRDGRCTLPVDGPGPCHGRITCTYFKRRVVRI